MSDETSGWTLFWVIVGGIVLWTLWGSFGADSSYTQSTSEAQQDPVPFGHPMDMR